MNGELYLIYCEKLGVVQDIYHMESPYIALVRTLVEYCTPLWSPSTKDNLMQLEQFQRKATTYILNNPPCNAPNHLNYKDHLIACKLLPTSYQREFYDIIFFLKTTKGLTQFKLIDYMTFIEDKTYDQLGIGLGD